MVRLNLLICGAALLGVVAGDASTFRVDVDSGEVIILQKSSLASNIVTKNGSIAMGDSMIVANGCQAAIQLENSSRLICKGPVNIGLSGENISLKIGLDGDGQIFLERNKPYDLGFIEIVSKGFLFRPIGTAAAIKTTRNGTPGTAVLEGKMNMQAPNGDVLIVEQGKYGTVDPSGKLVSEQLSPNAVELLQQLVSSSPKRGSTELANDGSSALQQEQIPQIAQSSETQAAQPVQQSIAAQPVNEKTTVENEPQSLTGTAQNIEPVKETGKDLKKESSKEANSAGETPVTAQGGKSDDKAGSGNDKQESEKTGEQEGADGDSKPKWEIGAGVVTIDNEQWTRIALGVDVPIWKFGVFFDIELFVDNNGKFSNKGWNFKDEPLEAITRKIRYIRFGHEQDPLFVKFGGLSSVTLGYGFLFDRFTNMLHYPDQKLLGLQFYLNDLSSIGLTLQTVIADFKDFNDDGGVIGGRLAIKPLKMSTIPIVNGISIGATYAVDLNQYAPARKWDVLVPASVRQYNYLVDLNVPSVEAIDSIISWGGNDPKEDSILYTMEKNAKTATDQFGLIGGDIGIPLIRTSLVNLDLYGQAGIRDDGVHGWGIGAPGLALNVSKFWASIEYRRVQGRFTPGYFGMYYLDERIIRNYADFSALSGTKISVKEDRIPDDELNGIFGKLGFNIANVLVVDGAYQYMVGKNSDNTDQRFEITGSLGDLLIQKIPKISKAEAYYCKSEIGNYVLKIGSDGKAQYDAFFDKTPFMYYGYRLGFEISQGATLIWDSRYGFKADKNGKLKENNFISVQTAITF